MKQATHSGLGRGTLALCVCLAVMLPEGLFAASRRLLDHRIAGLDVEISIHSVNAPMPIGDLINFAAQKGNLNIVTTAGVTGSVKLSLERVKIGDLIDIAVSSVKNPALAYEVREGIITIMTEEEYRQYHGVGFHDQRQMKIVEVQYADPAHVASMLQPIKSEGGSIVADTKTGTLVLLDTPGKLREMEQVIARAEMPSIERQMPTEIRRYALQNARTEEILAHVEPMLTVGVGKVQADTRTKTLLVEDTPGRLDKIASAIRQFDVALKQVFIEARVVEVTLDKEHILGVNWQHVFDGLDPRFRLESISAPMLGGLAGSPLAAGQLRYNAVVAGGELEAILQALQRVGETKSLSNPQIMVMDGQEAVVKVIEDQPYKERQFESGSTNIVSEVIKFVEVGVILSVVPRINDDGYIAVDISPEISSITTWFDGEPQRGTPVVRKALAETTVSVRDGVTIIIAGMIRDRAEDTVRSVPVLGRIPLLGALFRHTVKSKVNTETIIFLTPRIVTGDRSIARMKDVPKDPKPMRPLRGEAAGVTPAAIAN